MPRKNGCSQTGISASSGDHQRLGLATDAVTSMWDGRVHVEAVAGLKHPSPVSRFELDAPTQHEHELLAFVLEGNVLADRGGKSEYERLHVLVALGVGETFVVVSERGAAAHHRPPFAGTHHRNGLVVARTLALEEIGDIDLERSCNARQRRNRRHLPAVLDLREIARRKSGQGGKLIERDAARSACLPHSIAEDSVDFRCIVIEHRFSRRSPRSSPCSLAKPFDIR